MPEAGSDMGTCTLIVNENTEEVCNRPGEAEILVRNPFGLFATTLCSVHRRMHVEFYARRNNPGASMNGRTRRRVTKGSRV